MQIHLRKAPREVPDALRDQVTNDVCDALRSVRTVGADFVVNDTIWYGPSHGEMRARVVNTADFISQTFEAFLRDQRGWTRQKQLEGQKIDAYVELPVEGGCALGEEDLFLFMQDYRKHTDESPDTATVRIYQMYVQRTCFGINSIPEHLRPRFRDCDEPSVIRIGLEFETGNIASSFRAINKLAFLYRRGHIDAGVFITSKDKGSAAARIWPASNRNGSFEELERRNYADSIPFPIWEMGFALDGFDPNAEYLGRTATFGQAEARKSTVVIFRISRPMGDSAGHRSAYVR